MDIITKQSLIKSMERELESIDDETKEALKIEKGEERKFVLEELMREKNIIIDFYTNLIDKISANNDAKGDNNNI